MKRVFAAILSLILGGMAFAQEFALPEGPREEGEIRVLLIGNSFTYYCHTDSMLVDIARSQGVKIKIGKYLHGGRTFGQHLNIGSSRRAVEFGGYDFALLQDQSCTPAKYSLTGDTSLVNNFIRLKDNVLKYSPDCTVFLERTWTYPNLPAGNAEIFGTADSLDWHLREGCRLMARVGGTRVSPIGDAFALAAVEAPEIKLLGKDNHHQNPAGAYLKSCVNYLMITGKPFAGEVASCGVDAADAARLRAVAEKTVLETTFHTVPSGGKAPKYLVQGPKGGLSVKMVLPKGFDSVRDRCPVVILMHGIIASKNHPPLARIARMLAKNGIASVRFDFDGQGRSEGKCSDMTVPLEIEDAAAVWNAVTRLPFAGDIALLGHSLGGVVAGMLAGRLEQEGTPPDAVVLLAPGAVVRDLAREGHFLGVKCDPSNPPEVVNVYWYKIGKEFSKTAQVLPVYEETAPYTGPVCLIHGDRDAIVGSYYSDMYKHALQDSRLILIPRGNHWFLCHSRKTDAQILSFLQEKLSE